MTEKQMQNRQFEGGTGGDGANCSETLMGDGGRHAGNQTISGGQKQSQNEKKRVPESLARGVGRFFVIPQVR